MFALTAAAVLTFAAVGVNPVTSASADETTTTSGVTDDKPQGNLEKTLDLSDEYFYRWTRLTEANIDNLLNDGKEHRVLIVSEDGSQFMNATAPDQFWMGHKAQKIPSASESIRLSEADGKKYIGEKGTGYYACSDDNEEGYFLRSQYHVTQTDILPEKDVFFTPSHYNCPLITLSGIDNSNVHINGKQCRTYRIRIPSNAENQNHKYFLYTVNDDGYMMLGEDQEIGNWTIKTLVTDEQLNALKNASGDVKAAFMSTSDDAKPIISKFYAEHPSDLFEIFTERGGGDDDECLFYHDAYQVFYCVNDDHGGSKFHLFVGEEFHFRQMIQDTSVVKNTITPVTSGEYIGAGNKRMHAEGTIIPKGITLHVDKGGILAVEGNLINNGTIENEGLILIKKGGSISPFLPSGAPTLHGCGAIKMLGGDMIIQEGGAVYGGIGIGEYESLTDFNLDSGSTIINQGLLVFGGMKLSAGSRLELYPGSKSYGGVFIYRYSVCEKSKKTAGSVFDAIGSIYTGKGDLSETLKSAKWSAITVDNQSYEIDNPNVTNRMKTYHMSDLLFYENSYWLTGTGKTQLYPMELEDVKADTNWGDSVGLLPFGLFNAEGISTDSSLPIVKQGDNIVFKDYFIENKWLLKEKLTI